MTAPARQESRQNDAARCAAAARKGGEMNASDWEMVAVFGSLSVIAAFAAVFHLGKFRERILRDRSEARSGKRDRKFKNAEWKRRVDERLGKLETARATGEPE